MTSWTNPSVLALAGDRDPMEVVVERARTVVTDAMESGWAGPPFDILGLAERMGVRVVAHEDVFDARLIPGDSGPVVEFNPNRPNERRRFSLAHELAHLLFPDWKKTVRNRSTVDRSTGDDWQLEALCNVAAAELLMPAGSFAEVYESQLSIESALRLRPLLDVSMEALLLRFVRSSPNDAMAFAASWVDPNAAGRLRIDYSASSPGWSARLPTGTLLPRGTALEQCTAVGWSSTPIVEDWPRIGSVHVEALAIPPYPGHTLPRIVGLVLPADRAVRGSGPRLTEVRGDATIPRSDGPAIIAHVVNDRALTFHGGFAGALSRQYPTVEEDFSRWAAAVASPDRLGHVHITEVDEEVAVAHMVAQAGYGRSARPRIRYTALAQCLAFVAERARATHATIHIPRIGTGQAGGDWRIVSDLVRTEVVERGVSVTVYVPPGADTDGGQQMLDLTLES